MNQPLSLRHILIIFSILFVSHQIYAQCPPDDTETGGGTLVSETGVGGDPTKAEGEPDGQKTGNISGGDELTLGYPELNDGDQICFHLGFNKSDGEVDIEIDGNTETIENPSGATSYTVQEICIDIESDGITKATLSDGGPGKIKVDGSVYTRCVEGGSDEEDPIAEFDADNADSYVLLASKKISIKDNNVTGGIGIWQAGEEVKIEGASMIAGF